MSRVMLQKLSYSPTFFSFNLPPPASQRPFPIIPTMNTKREHPTVPPRPQSMKPALPPRPRSMKPDYVDASHSAGTAIPNKCSVSYLIENPPTKIISAPSAAGSNYVEGKNNHRCIPRKPVPCHSRQPIPAEERKFDTTVSSNLSTGPWKTNSWGFTPNEAEGRKTQRHSTYPTTGNAVPGIGPERQLREKFSFERPSRAPSVIGTVPTKSRLRIPLYDKMPDTPPSDSHEDQVVSFPNGNLSWSTLNRKGGWRGEECRISSVTAIEEIPQMYTPVSSISGTDIAKRIRPVSIYQPPTAYSLEESWAPQSSARLEGPAELSSFGTLQGYNANRNGDWGGEEPQNPRVTLRTEGYRMPQFKLDDSDEIYSSVDSLGAKSPTSESDRCEAETPPVQFVGARVEFPDVSDTNTVLTSEKFAASNEDHEDRYARWHTERTPHAHSRQEQRDPFVEAMAAVPRIPDGMQHRRATPPEPPRTQIDNTMAPLHRCLNPLEDWAMAMKQQTAESPPLLVPTTEDPRPSCAPSQEPIENDGSQGPTADDKSREPVRDGGIQVPVGEQPHEPVGDESHEPVKDKPQEPVENDGSQNPTANDESLEPVGEDGLRKPVGGEPHELVWDEPHKRVGEEPQEPVRDKPQESVKNDGPQKPIADDGLRKPHELVGDERHRPVKVDRQQKPAGDEPLKLVTDKLQEPVGDEGDSGRQEWDPLPQPPGSWPRSQSSSPVSAAYSQAKKERKQPGDPEESSCIVM